MKNSLFCALFALMLSTANAQDFASVNNTGAAYTTTSVNEKLLIISAYSRKPSVGKNDFTVEPNYEKLQALPVAESAVIDLVSNFEGSVTLTYVITNSSGEVVTMQDVKVGPGKRHWLIDMTNYDLGDYYITAQVKSKVTKAKSTFTYKVTRK